MTDTEGMKRQAEFMQALASVIDENLKDRFGHNIGFALFTFEFDNFDGGRVNYVSNADRKTMLAAIKEWAAREEGRYVEPDVTKKGLDS